MFVRIKGSGKKTVTYAVRHVEVTKITPESLAAKEGGATPGIEVKCCPGPTLRIPEDGDVIYLMNDGGDTIDTIALSRRKKSRRRKESQQSRRKSA